MSTTFRIKELKRFLKKRQPVKTIELVQFYRSFDSTISFHTVRWRIHELKKLQIIYSPARGQFALQERLPFLHNETQKMKKLAKVIQTNHSTTRFSIYSTEWLTRFSDFTYPSSNLIVDIEGKSMQAAYQTIQNMYSNVFFSK